MNHSAAPEASPKRADELPLCGCEHALEPHQGHALPSSTGCERNPSCRNARPSHLVKERAVAMLMLLACQRLHAYAATESDSTRLRRSEHGWHLGREPDGIPAEANIVRCSIPWTIR